MDGQKRRTEILAVLEGAAKPISATALAGQFSVSRQIIVGDIALLRAAGANVIATARGYVIQHQSGQEGYTLACRHTSEKTEAELQAIVDQGCTVVDVTVEHPYYGQLTGALNLSSRYDVGQFLQQCRETAAPPLATLTDGVHLHNILCPSEDAFRRVQAELKKLGILLEE